MFHAIVARPTAWVIVGFTVLALGMVPRALAAGVVGIGSPGSCTQATLETALTGGGLVTFNCGAAAVTIPLFVGTGETITSNTTVDGGALITIDSTIIDFPVFNVNPGVTLTVKNLTLVNTSTIAAVIPLIANQGTLVATNCTFSDTISPAIYTVSPCGPVPPCIPSGGVVTATNCTFMGGGGGLTEVGLIVPAPSVVADCTFSNAAAPAIVTHAAVAVTNTTFTGNTLGIESLASSGIVITNATFSGNHTAIMGAVTLINTIIANSSIKNCSSSTVTDGGHNLEDGSSCGFTAATSLSGTPAGLDPAGLHSNGGPTETIAPLATSAAVDGGDETVCATTSGTAPVDNLDQRGFVRPGAGHTHCSIGAYEFSFAPTPTATPSGAATPTSTPDEGGLVPPDTTTLACEDGVAKNASAFAACIRTCHIKAAHAAFKGKPFDEEACESTDPTKSCRAKYDTTVAKLVAGTCPACLGAAQQSALADQVNTQLDTSNGALYCKGTVALGGDDGGFVPPDKDTLACEAGVAKNARTLDACIDTCHIKAAHAAFKGKPFDEEACESTDPTKSCQAHYGLTASKLVAAGTCPACLALSAQTTLAAQLEAHLDNAVSGIYCAGTVPFS
jgi:hypothetical protein